MPSLVIAVVLVREPGFEICRAFFFSCTLPILQFYYLILQVSRDTCAKWISMSVRAILVSMATAPICKAIIIACATANLTAANIAIEKTLAKWYVSLP